MSCVSELSMLLLIAASANPARQQQAPTQTPAVNIAGVQTPWDVRTIIDGLIKENSEFQPVLTSTHPENWIAKGASPVYIQQLQQALQQTRDVVTTSRMLAQKTDKLSLALDEYFRLEALDITARSLEEGMRRYADRAAADKLSAFIAHNFSARERFRDYLSNLAVSQEENFKVADQEAQRCRAIISRAPDPCPSSAKRTKN
jgi:hypothetical protein